MKTVDVGAVLDDGQWGGYQKLLVFATALIIVLDGLDNQVFGGVIPVLMREWHLPRTAFTPVLTYGMVGMMIGGAIGGIIGDKLGRRVALLLSILTFGLLTLLLPTATTPTMLIVLRFLAGLGLGGAMPNAAALSSEYVPTRHRPFAVTLTIMCIPFGGSLAGFVAGEVLPRWGWHTLFYICGVIPLVLLAVLLKVLPESPRFMARQKARWGELTALLRRLGHDVPADAVFADTREKAVKQASFKELFAPEYLRDTLALCGSFFFCLLSVYMGTNWVPSMLTGAKFSVGTASYGLTAFNFGGVVGAMLGAALIVRLGSRLSMLTMAAAAIAGAGVLAMMQIGPENTVAVFAMLAWTGGLINAVQTTMYALAAHVYPTSVRATGVGTAVAFGRIGGVLSPSLGSWAMAGGMSGYLAAVNPSLGSWAGAGGASPYFALIASTMTLAFVSLAIVRNHVPGRSSGAPVAARAVAAAH
jgi:AAHS family 4-hydroxybenzoate transporter-like MFS transporter